jgi:hypothetical protein
MFSVGNGSPLSFCEVVYVAVLFLTSFTALLWGGTVYTISEFSMNDTSAMLFLFYDRLKLLED